MRYRNSLPLHQSVLQETVTLHRTMNNSHVHNLFNLFCYSNAMYSCIDLMCTAELLSLEFRKHTLMSSNGINIHNNIYDTG